MTAPNDELKALDDIFKTICPTMTWPSGMECQQGRITLEQYNIIRAAIIRSDLAPTSQWRDISTMPKPYPSSIILVTNGGGTWPATYTHGVEGDGFYECNSRYGRINGVTHWMPLPLPPTKDLADAEGEK